MIKEKKRLKAQLLLKYFILLGIIAVIALVNIYNIEQQKNDAGNIADNVSTSQLIATDTEMNAKEATNTNSDALLKEADLQKILKNNGKGIATISMSENFFVHQVNLETKDPEQNSVYEAWIYKAAPQKEYFPLGQLYSKDGLYQISYVSELNRLDFTKIMISEEPVDKELGRKPTKVLFEGEYKDIE